MLGFGASHLYANLHPYRYLIGIVIKFIILV